MRERRTREQIKSLSEQVIQIVGENKPVTVRQVYYLAVSAGIIAKTEQAYKGIARLLGQLRLSGGIPFSSVADNTRWMRKPDTYNTLSDKLEQDIRDYKRDVWNEQKDYVEVWLEKDALAGVLYAVTGEWHVPLMVTRGYASLSYLHSAARQIENTHKPAYIYYFGDYDPSGLDIPRNVERRLREFAPKAEIHFERVAVNPKQIEQFKLQTRPTKKTDSRSRTFVGNSVEVDAIPPKKLRELAEKLILSHLDNRQLEMTRTIEAEERQTLRAVSWNFEERTEDDYRLKSEEKRKADIAALDEQEREDERLAAIYKLTPHEVWTARKLWSHEPLEDVLVRFAKMREEAYRKVLNGEADEEE